jgi:hypothetical protein
MWMVMALHGAALAAGPDSGPEQRHEILNQGEVGIGLTVPAHTTWDSDFRLNGEKVERRMTRSTTVYALDPAVGLIDGLEIGARLPVVQNIAGRAGDPETTRFGLGDISFHAGGEARFDRVGLGGRLSVKAPSGQSTPEGANPALPLGSGQPDMDITAHLTQWSGGIHLLGTVGYQIRFEGEKVQDGRSVDFKPGGVLHLEGGLQSWSSGRYSAGIAVLYHVSEADQIEQAENMEAVGEGSALTSAVVSFTVRAAEFLDLSIETRTENVAGSLSLVDTGIPMWGRNTPAAKMVPIQIRADFRI